MDWKNEAKTLRFEQNKSWTDIAKILKDKGYFPNVELHRTKERIRGYIRSLPEYKAKQKQVIDDIKSGYSSKIEYKSDGSTTFEGIIALMEGEPITPEIIMKAHNLDNKEWDVVTYRNNFWQTQAKGGRKLLLYQSKITVKPKKKQEITFEDIDRYFEAKDYSKDKLPIECIDYDPVGEILEIKVPDLHIGLLSWREETGSDYDLKIVKKHFFMCINDIVERCKHTKLKKIVFVTLGDILHVDNDDGTTTKGTKQQVDGRMAKITECAEDMLIDGITILGELAPVEYIYVAGNHDRVCGYMLARSIANVFRNDPNVICDTSPNPIKYRRFGVSLVLYHHGDAPKKNLGEIPMKFAREEISKSKFVEINLGHQHIEETTYVNGYRVRHFPVICASSYWEHQQAYGNDMKAIVCDIRNEKTGLRDTWYTMI
ncbi:MAG: hypothetical protein E7215_17120 [Clostridium sulfidigenes]|uniref:Calcineurin-like phosphoesterase domain-containing protein n=1 Tax=Clostridium sulfidigenes TaxID=318464 RepID=A0A927WBK5_9CLOT|nr:hypothetical protein [Clostridium sulfidigenes]